MLNDRRNNIWEGKPRIRFVLLLMLLTIIAFMTMLIAIVKDLIARVVLVASQFAKAISE